MCVNSQALNDDGNIVNADQIERWKDRDIEARSYIYATMGPNQQSALQGCETATEMWNRIQTEYAESSEESRPLLWSQFNGYKFQSGKY